MTEAVFGGPSNRPKNCSRPIPQDTVVQIDVFGSGRQALSRRTSAAAWRWRPAEIDYLYGAYKSLGRNPTDVELVMFSQVNSEHCRHKTFNAELDDRR